jgi:hypothetical protein
MKSRWPFVVVILTAMGYTALCVRGWLGVEEMNKRSPDDKYWAAVYSHSKLFSPFWKTHDVIIPSTGDLNSHTVFESRGFRQIVGIEWLDSQNLEITCRHCNEGRLLTSKVDNISVHLLEQ